MAESTEPLEKKVKILKHNFEVMEKILKLTEAKHAQEIKEKEAIIKALSEKIGAKFCVPNTTDVEVLKALIMKLRKDNEDHLNQAAKRADEVKTNINKLWKKIDELQTKNRALEMELLTRPPSKKNYYSEDKAADEVNKKGKRMRKLYTANFS